jgi:putative ABC transport system ATP-binding protein
MSCLKVDRGSAIRHYARPSFSKLQSFVRLARPEARLLGHGTLLLIASSAASMIVPFAIGKIIDHVVSLDPKQHQSSSDLEETSPGESSSYTLLGMLSMLGGMFVLAGFANYGRIYAFKSAGERLGNRIREQMYRSLMLHHPITFFDKNSTGDLISRIGSDTSVISKSLSINLADGARSILAVTMGGALMAYASSELSKSILLLVPPLALLSVVYGRYVKNLSKSTQAAIGNLFKLSEEKIANIRTIRSFSMESKELDQFSSENRSILSLGNRDAYASASFYVAVSSAANIALLIILWKAGNMVVQGLITVGDLSSFLMYAVYVGSSVSGLASFMSELMRGIGAYERILPVLSLDTQDKETLPGPFPLDLVPEIQLDHIGFSYPTRPDHTIFKDCSFTIPPGQIIALVGASGSGKTTIASLLLKLYAPDTGKILVRDPRSSKTYSLFDDIPTDWWHRHMVSIVPQEPVLFSGTIAYNIAYGKPGATMEEIRHAAVQANALEFIEGFLDRFQTIVGERGIALSGGQKQRIAIARAWLLCPKILILDEATSALDTQSENAIQKILQSRNDHMTIIIIAHRLSTIRSASRILFIDSGSIQADGTFDELSRDKTTRFYKTILSLQEKSIGIK